MNSHSEHFPGSTSDLATLIDLLRWRARSEPTQRAYSFLVDMETQAAALTYAELERRALSVGALLQSEGASGERVLLLYPPGLDYVCALFGCLYAGAVPVPAYPPRLNKSLNRLQAIVADSQAKLALTTPQIRTRAASRFGDAPGLSPLRWVTWEDGADDLADEWREPIINERDLALLQYTSGSTGTPRGVMLSHQNLLHNSRLLSYAFGYTAESHCVSWLPPYHDMGLIGGILQPLYGSFPCTLMAPAFFLQRPLRWLQTIARDRGTISGGPNFAYDLCVRKSNRDERAGLDLSCWSVAFNGSEPVRKETLERFAEAFAPSGFRPSSFYPCYGLAEATLIVSGSKRGVLPTVKEVGPEALAHNVVADAAGTEALSLVGCGEVLPGQQTLVVECETLLAAPCGKIGEIWVAGPSVAEGYWRDREETVRTFQAHLAESGAGPFLRTGDLGFIEDGELFITGRLKDLIVIRGLNHYPQDIELTVEKCNPTLRPGCGAAFSVEHAGEERLVVAQEVAGREPRNLSTVAELIRQSISEAHGLDVHAILLLRPGNIPKTSSGKVQRRACKQSFLRGSLKAVWEWHRAASPASEPAHASPAPTLDSVPTIEAHLISQLAAKLGLEPSEIDVNRPLTYYGVDSLFSVELTYQLEAGLGVSLSVADLLECASITQGAEIVFAQSKAWSAAGKDPLTAAPAETAEFPLSYGQQALWFLYEFNPQSSAYNIARAVRLDDNVDTDTLRRAFQALLKRHRALRTTFHAAPGGPFQRIHAQGELCFRQEDATAWSAAQLNQRLSEEAHRPFDLKRGPLLRVNVYTRSAHELVLLLTIHHIVADFWSLAVLAHELGVIYQAEKSGRSAHLPPLPLSYTDYVRHQAELLAGPKGDALWDYWERQLGGPLPVLSLPARGPRPPVQTFRGATHSFRLGAVLTEGLRSLCRDAQATLYMSLLAAFQVLLCRYSGHEAVIVGCSTAGRSRAELANIVGYFVNPVALRADLTSNPTFNAFLLQVRQTVLDAFAHQDFPFALLVERLSPPRDAARSPLFQTMFVFQKTHLSDEEGLASLALSESGAHINLSGLEVETFGLEQQIAQFDLSMAVAQVDVDLAISVEYNTDLFDAATIKQLALHFETLLASAVTDPEQRVFDLTLMTDDERRQVVEEWNETGRENEERSCIHELFEKQVERRPEAVALVSKGQEVSYRELNQRANRLAHSLIKQGVRAESVVGILQERSVELVISLLAVLKAGAAYLALDRRQPGERISFMLEDAGVEVLLTKEELAEELPLYWGRTMYVEGERERLEEMNGENPRRAVSGENLAYVIYTSGSTGQPKGVMIEQRSLSNYVQWARVAYGLEEGQGAPMHTSISFDLTLTSLYGPLVSGGWVHLLADEETAAGQAAGLSAALTTEGEYGLVKLTPAHLEMLKGTLSGEQAGRASRCLVVGGEQLRPETARWWREQAPGTRLYNEYGPTEATVGCCVQEVGEEETSRGGAVPIGRPIANTQLYVLDNEGEPVGIGLSGELYIGGLGLGRGYLGRADLTADRFVPDGLSGAAGARLYRTGDLARYRAGGVIECLGRADNQVKVRGYRIELGEIEAALRQHGRVRESIAVVKENDAGDKRLIAYVIPDQQYVTNQITTSDLRNYLREKLPEYMVPSQYVVLSELPLTANGKVDRGRLPEPSPENSEESYIAPSTPVEEVLASIWSEVFGAGQVSVNENFFNLGGHSLMAVQVVARLKDRFALDIRVDTLFENPTVRGLAAAIDGLLVEQISQITDEEVQMLLEEH